MSTDQNKDKPAEDIITDVENKPAEKGSRITHLFNLVSVIGEGLTKAKDIVVGAAEFAVRAYNIPAVKATILSPYAKAQTPVEKTIAYGVLAAGIGVGVATYGWGFTIAGSKLLGSAVACKGTQFGVQFATRLFNGKAANKPLVTEDNEPVITSTADQDMGEETPAKGKPKLNTKNKTDLDIF